MAAGFQEEGALDWARLGMVLFLGVLEDTWQIPLSTIPETPLIGAYLNTAFVMAKSTSGWLVLEDTEVIKCSAASAIQQSQNDPKNLSQRIADILIDDIFRRVQLLGWVVIWYGLVFIREIALLLKTAISENPLVYEPLYEAITSGCQAALMNCGPSLQCFLGDWENFLSRFQEQVAAAAPTDSTVAGVADLFEGMSM